MNFDVKVRKILKESNWINELYPNEYDFDGDKDKDKGDTINFDVYHEMLQLVKIFQTYNNIDSAAEVEQELKKIYNQWSGEAQAAVVFELMNMAQQGNSQWEYIANTILSIIVPGPDDSSDPGISRR